MIREPVLPGTHRRPTGQAAAAVPFLQGPVPAPSSRPRLVELHPGGSSAGVEAAVLAQLVQQDLPAGSLLDTLARLTAEALQQAPNSVEAFTPSEVRGVAARIATGLAVALLESDLSERITARLAQEAPFAEGWRSCPE